MSRGRGPRGEPPLPERANVAYALDRVWSWARLPRSRPREPGVRVGHGAFQRTFPPPSRSPMLASCPRLAETPPQREHHECGTATRELPSLILSLQPVEALCQHVQRGRSHGGPPGFTVSDHYWISSSARPSTDGGIVRPRAVAVLRLMTSSNVVGCSTGRSAGLAPLRILST